MICPECGTTSENEQRFCGDCGARLPQENKRGTMPLPQRMGGERRLATILLADIKGFTSMAERLDPEQVTLLINAAFEKLASSVQQAGGMVDKYIGDAMLVLFGLPESQPDDPSRALQCALDMLVQISAFNTEFAETLPNPISLHIGVNTGLLMIGPLGAGSRATGVIGDALNVAAHLEDIGGHDEIIVGDATYQLATAEFTWGESGSVVVKDKIGAVGYHRLLAVRQPVAV